MIIKNFKIFEAVYFNRSITNIEVKNIISDVLLDFNDLNLNFVWNCYIPNDDNLFDSCHLKIKCSDNVSKNTDWIEILERLFYLIRDEGIKILEKKDIHYIDVIPGAIDLEWTAKVPLNDLYFTYGNRQTWWEKEFVFLY